MKFENILLIVLLTTTALVGQTEQSSENRYFQVSPGLIKRVKCQMFDLKNRVEEMQDTVEVCDFSGQTKDWESLSKENCEKELDLADDDKSIDILRPIISRKISDCYILQLEEDGEMNAYYLFGFAYDTDSQVLSLRGNGTTALSDLETLVVTKNFMYGLRNFCSNQIELASASLSVSRIEATNINQYRITYVSVKLQWYEAEIIKKYFMPSSRN